MKELNPMILVVDDEPALTDLLTYNLQREHYRVCVAHTGPDALRLAQAQRPDLIILDLMLPGLDGFDVCKALRRESDVPIIMLTARDEEVDRVVGLELGADDYVTKPFSVRELLARVKNVLRRVGTQDLPPREPEEAPVTVGPLSLDEPARRATLSGQPLGLTALEFDLLLYLAHHRGQALSREQFLSQVWGYDYPGNDRAVDSAIKRLRAKLRRAGLEAELIETVRGVGYRLEC